MQQTLTISGYAVFDNKHIGSFISGFVEGVVIGIAEIFLLMRLMAVV